jgi:hypothetical protein
VKAGSQGYKIKINAHSGGGRTHQSEIDAETIADAERRAGVLILKYANPAAYASAIHVNDPQSVGEALLTVPDRWTKLHSRSLPYTILGYFSLINQQLSAQTANLSIAAEYFDRALRQNKSDVFAEIGIIVARARISAMLASKTNHTTLQSDARRLALPSPSASTHTPRKRPYTAKLENIQRRH